MSARSRRKQPRFCRRFSLEVFFRMLAETSRLLLLLLLPLQYCYILLATASLFPNDNRIRAVNFLCVSFSTS